MERVSGEAIFPMVPGPEIAGVVAAVGKNVTPHKVGDRVGVGCFVDSCRRCAECQQGLDQYCTVGTIWTYNSRDKEGNPTYGGYSQRIVVDENYVLRMSGNLPLKACAPLEAISRSAESRRHHGRSRTSRQRHSDRCLLSLTSGRRSLAGSQIGRIKQTQEMLDFCAAHNIAGDVEVVPIQKVYEAYERVLKIDVRYRFVIDMAALK